MTDIIFFNLCSIGDIYFTIPFLKWICNANPHRTFVFYTRYASFLQEGIPNLKRYDNQDLPLEHPDNLKHYEFFHQYDRSIFTRLEDNRILLFNTWVAPLNERMVPIDCECSPKGLALAYQRLFEEINQYIPDPFFLPPLSKIDCLYKFPPLNIDRFLEYKKTVGKELLFYFNRMGASADSKPFSTEKDHLDMLKQLSTLYPEKIIVVPNARLKPDCSNIVCTADFGVQEDHTCKNVLEDMEIAGHCTYAVLFDIGAAYTYCNQNYLSYPAQFFHISKRDFFVKQLKDSLEYCLDTSIHNLTYVYASKPEEVVREIRERIA